MGREMRERPTVVLLHGGPGSYDHSYFKPDFARLSASAQVIYLDLRGHGRSAWGDPAAWSFEVCADDVRAFCDALGIARPVVYGHSMGGFVAMLYAARHSGHASALVLQSTMARFDLERLVEGFRRLGGEEVAEARRALLFAATRCPTRSGSRVFAVVRAACSGGGRASPQDPEPRTERCTALELLRTFDVVDQLCERRLPDAGLRRRPRPGHPGGRRPARSPPRCPRGSRRSR